MMLRFIFLLLFLCSCSSSSGGITETNDFFMGLLKKGGPEDRDFTQGLAFSYTSKGEYSRKYANHLPELALTRPTKELPDVVSYQIGQHLRTPEDISTTENIPDDIPYSGWLFSSVKRTNLYEDGKIETGLTLGVVGPAALGEETQTWFHELIDSDKPYGWGNQIENEPGIILEHRREWDDYRSEHVAVLTGVFARGGNIHIDSGHYTTLMIGWNLPQYIDSVTDWRLYLFSTIKTNAVVRNIFIDGNTIGGKKTELEKEWKYAEIDYGIALGLWRVAAKFYGKTASKQYDTDHVEHSIGIIELGSTF